MSEEPDLELEISDTIRPGAYVPDHVARLRDLVARLRASNRSAIIFVDGQRGTIQIWNAVPAGVIKIR